MIAKALLDHDPAPTRDEIVDALAGNICRCTGYEPIVEAIEDAAAATPADGARPDDRAASTSSAGRSTRSDGVGHVTGRTAVHRRPHFPGMLHLKMVRSPLHHARIRGIDLSEAERVPGLRPGADRTRTSRTTCYTILGLIGVEPEEEFVLAEDRVRYKGEPIVAIVAETEAAAYEAVAKVRLDLEELPAVFDVEEALAPGAPIVTHWGNNTFMYEGHPCRRVRFGDVEAGVRRGRPHRRGRVPTRARSSTRPIETTGCIAVPEANGRYTVYTNTQALYFSLDNTSIILQVPGNRLHFVGGTVGGGFGGKVDVIVEPHRDAGGDEDRPPGALRLQPLGGDAGLAPRAAPWRIYIKDGVMARRADHRPQGHELRGLRRLQPPDALRAHQARGERRRAVRHPERLDRRLLRLHEPAADERDARLRRHDGVVRARGPDGQDRRARSASTRGPSGSSTPTATAT